MHLACAAEKPIFERPVGHISETADRIGQLIAENLVEDEATLQMGIGAIPDAVLARLKNHRNLGIHTEMFSDGVMDLVNSGSVTNAVKSTHVGKIIGGKAIACVDVVLLGPITGHCVDMAPLLPQGLLLVLGNCTIGWMTTPSS